jgi:hypothetical protein
MAKLTLLYALLSAGCTALGGAHAQQAHSPAQSPSVAVLLDLFERNMTAGGRGLPPSGITHMLTSPESYSAARLDSLDVGLERLAVHAASQHVAVHAATHLASAGDTRGSARPGIVSRLERIHRTSSDPAARSIALQRMPFQADRGGALRAVVRTAESPTREQPYPGAARQAVELLREFGTPGQDALRTLLSAGRIHDPDARDEARRGLQP